MKSKWGQIRGPSEFERNICEAREDLHETNGSQPWIQTIAKESIWNSYWTNNSPYMSNNGLKRPDAKPTCVHSECIRRRRRPIRTQENQMENRYGTNKNPYGVDMKTIQIFAIVIGANGVHTRKPDNLIWGTRCSHRRLGGCDKTIHESKRKLWQDISSSDGRKRVQLYKRFGLNLA